MRNLKRKLIVSVLVSIVLVTVYVGMVNVVDALGDGDLIKSFELRSERRDVVSNILEVGDTMVVVAKSNTADTYGLRVLDNGSVIFAQNGTFQGSKATVDVLLNPPKFNAGKTYGVIFDAYSFNDPIPGAYLSDSAAAAFDVVGVETKIGLETEYESSAGSLHLNASLTTVDGYEVTNETVEFSLQFASKRRPTEGWVPIGSTVTDAAGKAELKVAFALPDGSYFFKAYHAANGNFGKSENITEINVSSNITIESYPSHTWYSSLSSSLVYDIGNLTIEVSNQSQYALLPFGAKATYVINATLQVLMPKFIVFFLDLPDSTQFLSATTFVYPSQSGTGVLPEVYEASLVWDADVIGSHNIIASFIISNSWDVSESIVNGYWMASAEVAVDIFPCPTNIVLDLPDVLYGDILPIAVVISKPRPYLAALTGLFVTVTLSPRFYYNNVEYVFDEGLEGVPLKLYVNDVLAFVNSSNTDGLVYFRVPIGSGTMRFRVVVDDFPLISAEPVERDVTLRKVRVDDKSTAVSSVYHLSFSVDGNKNAQGELYVGATYGLEVNSSLYDQPVWGLPVSLVGAKLISSVQTDSLRSAAIPVGADYVRIQNTTLLEYILEADLNEDGVVDMADMQIVADAMPSYPGSTWPVWNVDADLNHDNLINVIDLATVSTRVGLIAYYLVFDTNETVLLDSRGFARIPSGAQSLKVMTNDYTFSQALVEFFNIEFEASTSSDNFGKARGSWAPNEVGRYVLQAKLPRKFDLSTTQQTSTVSTEFPTNLVTYINTVKRTINISVEYAPVQPTPGSTVNVIADVFDAGLGQPAEQGLTMQFYVMDANGNLILNGSSSTNSSGVAVFSWIPASNIAYNVVVDYSGNAVYNGASATLSLDLRTPTDLRVRQELVQARFDSEPSLDGYMYKYGASYPPAVLNVPVTNYWWLTVGQYKQYLPENQLYYQINRGYISFDTSVLPDNAYISSATLELKTKTDLTIYTTDFMVQVMGGSQPIYGPSLGAADWGVGAVLAGQWDTADYEDETYIQIQIATSQINPSGRTQFELRSSREGTESLPPDEMVEFYSSDSSGNEPHLKVVYELEMADNSTVNVNTSVDYHFRVEDLPANSAGESVSVYVDGSLHTTAQVTGYAGVPAAFFSWRAESPGVHYVNVSYRGNQHFKPDDVNFAAIASASPVSLNFSVTPTEFEAGDSINLWARAINPLTGDPLRVEIGFWQDGYGSGVQVGNYSLTDENGVATGIWNYPTDGSAHTIAAKVKAGQALGNVTLAIKPITLTVGVETRLWLWVERGLTNTEHTVYARLVRADGSAPISPSRPIKLDVSGKAYTLMTNGTGHVTQHLNLEAVGGQSTTYYVRAVFEGAGFKTRNLTITDPYGHDYPVCTTMQWDFRSSQNSATLTVEAPKTDAAVSEPASPEDTVTVTQTPETTTVTVPPPKTPEQMQQEAEQSGWLTTWHEFTWWYPWYRLHVQFSMNGAKLHIGFNPILPFGEIIEAENLGNIIAPINSNPTIPIEELKRLVLEMLESSIVDVLAAAATTLAAGNTRFPPIIAIALVGYAGFLSYLGYHAMQDLYNVGLRNAGKAYMAGIFVGLASVFLSTILGLAALSGATIITTNVVFAMIGALVGNAYDPKPAMDYVRTLTIASLGAIAVSALTLRIPEPIGNTFLFCFLMITIVAMGASAISVGIMG